MVAALFDQVADDDAHGLDAQPTALAAGTEEDVDVCVPSVRIGLLPELDVARDLAVHHDGQPMETGLGVQRPAVFRRLPPACHLGREPERPELLGVLRADWFEGEAVALQGGNLHEHMVTSGVAALGAPATWGQRPAHGPDEVGGTTRLCKDAIPEPNEAVLECLAREALEWACGNRCRAAPPTIRGGARHTGVNQQAELVHEAAAEQRADERSAAVDPHDPGPFPFTQRAERRAKVHALAARHDLSFGAASGAR